MGRHSAADSDEAEDAPVAPAADPAAARRGRHNRDEDIEDTGPIPGTEMRRLDARAAAQDAQPTEVITLTDLLIEPDERADRAEPDEKQPDEKQPDTQLPDAQAAPDQQAGPDQQAPPDGRAEPDEQAAAADGAPAPEPGAEVKEQPAGRRSPSTAADLALLRRHADVRNRVIGAVLVPFVLYAAVMLLLGVAGVQYLLWIWIPLVSAGVLAGLILDAAHRHRPAPDEEPSG